MTSTRDQFIETTCALIEIQGVHATGLNQITAESGAPKGSLYYHFPGGKEELVAAAIERVGRRIAAAIGNNLDETRPLPEAVHAFIDNIASAIEESGFETGGPLTSATIETAATNERLNLACREAFSEIRSAFAEKIARFGVPDAHAARLATLITACIEGATILCRADHSGAPLRLVADDLQDLLSGPTS